MNELRPWLASTELLDCHGQVSHRLVLEPDGTVSITFLPGGHQARVDPTTRANLTPAIHVPDGLLDAAQGLTPW